MSESSLNPSPSYKYLITLRRPMQVVVDSGRSAMVNIIYAVYLFTETRVIQVTSTYVYTEELLNILTPCNAELTIPLSNITGWQLQETE